MAKEADAQETLSLLSIGVRYVGWSLYTTVMGIGVVGALSSPSILAFISAPSIPMTGGAAFLVVLGLSVYISQEILMKGVPERETGFKAPLILLSIFYYNAILWVALVLTVSTYNQGYHTLASLVALTYPIYDVITSRRLNPLSVGGLLGLSILVLGRVYKKYQHLTWSELRVEGQPFKNLRTGRT